MAWTTTELLADIRRRARLSTTDPDHTDANLLLDADSVMDEVIVPLVLIARSDYYTRHEDQSIVAEQQTYPIPSRAVASVPRQVFWVDGSGTYRELAYLTLADSLGFNDSGEPEAYTIRDNEVWLLPTPSTASGSLRIAYEYQPGKLVLPSACAVVEGVDRTTGTLDCTDVPTTWTNATILDIVKGTSPFVLLAADLDPTTVTTGASGSVDFVATDLPDASRLPSSATGDYICPAGYSCIPQIPADLHSLLALGVAVEVLDQVGDPLANLMRQKLGQALTAAQRKLSPRVKGSPQKIVSRNSPLRRGRRARWSVSVP